jgi:hypothetical protein
MLEDGLPKRVLHGFARQRSTGRSLLGSGPLLVCLFQRLSPYGPVIVMKCPVKPTKSSVYVKLESVIPPGIVGVQFGLGHDCCARKALRDGALAESDGTVSLPFFGES